MSIWRKIIESVSGNVSASSMRRFREMQSIYATLLHNVAEFQGFVEFVGAKVMIKCELLNW